MKIHSERQIRRHRWLTPLLLSDSIKSQSFNKMANEKGVAAAIAFSPFLGVQDDWLLMAFAEAEKNYGSVDNYLLEGLAITPETKAELREKLLMP